MRKQYLARTTGPDHDGPRHARHELLQGGRRPLRVGARQGARHQHHRPRRDGPLRLHEDAAARPQGAWTCSTRTRPTSTRRTCSTTSGRWSPTPAATCRSRRRSSCRWATAGRRPQMAAKLRHPGRPVVRRGHDRVVRPVHPDARDLRLRAGAAARRSPGTRTSTATTPTRRPDRLAPGPALGDARRGQGRRRSAIGPARSRPARRPTS